MLIQNPCPKLAQEWPWHSTKFTSASAFKRQVTCILRSNNPMLYTWWRWTALRHGSLGPNVGILHSAWCNSLMVCNEDRWQGQGLGGTAWHYSSKRAGMRSSIGSFHAALSWFACISAVETILDTSCPMFAKNNVGSTPGPTQQFIVKGHLPFPGFVSEEQSHQISWFHLSNPSLKNWEMVSVAGILSIPTLAGTNTPECSSATLQEMWQSTMQVFMQRHLAYRLHFW